MSTLSFLGEPRVPRLQKLLEEIRAGEILVSRFQRPFVWSDDQRLALLDSIYNGYPIGAILVWRTQKHELRTFDRLGPLFLPESGKAGPTRQYLLDGHQRITTLFTALGPALYSRENGQTPRWMTADQDALSRWPIYFQLDYDAEGPGVRSPFRLAKTTGPQPSTWLPLDILFDSYALREFEDKLRSQNLGRSLVNRVQNVADSFRDYTVPVMPIATEDLSRVTTSFKRVNSGGTPMNEVHMINALTYTADFDFLLKLNDLAEDLREVGWHKFEQQMILHICKARVGMSLYDEEPEEIAARILKDPKLLDEVRSDIFKVADVLKQVAGVRGPQSLPYSYQAVLLADALHDVDSPSVAQIARLRIWFWSTTLTEYFRGMTKALFERAKQHLRATVKGKAPPQPPDLPSVVERVLRWDYRAARSRGTALMLAEVQKNHAWSTSRDPFETLAEFGAGALIRLCATRDVSRNEKELTESFGNRFLVHPDDVAQFRTVKKGPDLLAATFVESHLVDNEAFVAMRDHRWGDFLRIRRTAIERLVHERAIECGIPFRGFDATLESAKTALLQMAKQELSRLQSSTGSSALEIRFSLDSETELNAAFALEADGHGETEMDEGRWVFVYRWTHPAH